MATVPIRGIPAPPLSPALAEVQLPEGLQRSPVHAAVRLPGGLPLSPAPAEIPPRGQGRRPGVPVGEDIDHRDRIIFIKDPGVAGIFVVYALLNVASAPVSIYQMGLCLYCK